MPALISILQAFVLALFAWVLVFQVGLALHLSVLSIGLSFFALLAVGSVFFLRHLRQALLRSSKAELQFCTAVLIVGLALAIPTLTLSRPDADEVGYIHQYLEDVSRPSQAFTSSLFGAPFGGNYYQIPGFTEHEAYEAMVATTAGLLGLDTVFAYHNGFPVVFCLVWASVYALLLRRFRLGRKGAIFGIIGAAAFLLLDGNLHRSFGNMGFPRIWQGKAMAITILIPALLYYCMRLASRPRLGRGVMVFALAFTIVAMNRSMLFLVPVLCISIASAWIIGYRRTQRRQLPLVVGIAAVVLVAVFAALGLAYALRSQLPAAELLAGFDAIKDWRTHQGSRSGVVWWEHMNDAIIGHPLILVRNAWLLFAVPLLVCSAPLRRFLPLLSLILFLLTFSPWMGAFWFFLIEGVSWRLYYAFPLPLCVGLATAALASIRGGAAWASYARLAPAVGGLVSVVLVGVSTETPTWSPSNTVSLKRPTEYRFHPEGLAYSRQLAPIARGKRVLAPNLITNIWALTEPASVDLVEARWMRQWATSPERFMTRCPRDRVPRLANFMLQNPPDVELLVLRQCPGNVVEQFARRGFTLTPVLTPGQETSNDLSAYLVTRWPPASPKALPSRSGKQ